MRGARHSRSHFRSGRLAGTGVLLAALLAPIALAGTMGFTRQFHFPPGTAPGTSPDLHWISLPWVYQPEDFGTPGVVDAEDLCRDLGGEDTVAAVLRWDEPTSTLVEHACATADPFPLVRGEGYAVRNVPGRTIHGVVAGVHDDDFAYSIPASGGSQLSWLSVPYHLRMPEKQGDPRIDAEDLCRQVGLAEVLAVVRWDKTAGAYEAYACGSRLAAPFGIVRGEAYGLVNRGPETLHWQPVHY